MSASPSTHQALGLAFGLLLAGCGAPTAPEADPVEVISETVKETELVNLGGRMFSIPSPVQAAIAIRTAGLKYQRDHTVPLDRGDAVVGKVGQSMLLGMYGADMAYVTVHSDGQRALATLASIEKLGAKLELSNAFDRALLERFRSNIGSEDSLLRFSGAAFRAADQYLKNDQRDDVSALVLAGGWVESMHLTLADPEAANNASLMARIGEQKNTLDGLVELLDAMGPDASNAEMLKGMRAIQSDLASATSTYTFQKPVTDMATKTTYINSVSSVTIPADKLQAIAAKVAALRTLILA